ncbi:hypothetical protein Golomagni_07127 [Golovinomyces magnicellulatus]|nr:hypothetical protein Golomagni_07127 [Golovinomyces magnicellulatus]
MKLTTLLVAATAVIALPVPTPPGIPDTAAARSQLAGLGVEAQGSGDGYSRENEYVLKRDGDGVQVNNACTATAGTWKSPYDGATWKNASDIDIDHMVPLKNAWVSGASAWTTEQRKAFANDITRPQLWAVTNSVNRSKGDKSPDSWKPPLKTFYCIYAKSWIQVKSHYELHITSAEKTALSGMLDSC